jgi:thiol-disulfide isomerase/thioredoxin
LKGFGTTLDNTPFNVISTGNFFNNKPPQVKREDFLDVYENLINMDQFKGKNLYITFWATWCGPCIGEQPKLEELKAEFADNDDIIFVDISLDKDHEKWLDHVTKTQPKGIQLISKSTGKTRANFNVSSTPHHVVVNQDGYYRSIAKPRFIKNEMLLNSYSIDKHVMN